MVCNQISYLLKLNENSVTNKEKMRGKNTEEIMKKRENFLLLDRILATLTNLSPSCLPKQGFLGVS